MQKRFKKNPHIIQFYGSEKANKKIFYIIFELGNCSLRQAINFKNIVEKEFVAIMRCIADGLHSVHSAKMIHRDIKPENIIRVNNQYKITDFGVSTGK